MPLTTEDIKGLIRVALGKEKADLVIKGGNLINVYTGELLENYSIAIKGDRIAFVGEDANHTIGNSTQILDVSGKILAPGFIDGHFHAYISFDEFLKHSIPQGTTTIFVELLDVSLIAGYEGAVALLDSVKGQPSKVFGTAPSPYPPPTFLKQAIIPISTEEIDRLLQRDDVLALGESLWTCVIDEDDEVIENIVNAINKGKKLEGHSSAAKGNKLIAYAASGVSSCHESIRAQEAIDRLRLGMHVMIREGTIREDLEAISEIKDKNIDFRRLVLVTDGVDANYLFHHGHMAHLVQKAINLGFPPIEAIRMATLNVAEHFGLDNLIGGIAPGKYADILVLSSLTEINCEYVISNGQIVVENKRNLVQTKAYSYPESIMKSINVPRDFTPDDFTISAGGRKDKVTVRVMKMITAVIAEEIQAELPVDHDSILGDLEQDILKVSIIERRTNSGKVISGFIQGIGIKSGACACSFSWEMGSPMVVVGTNEIDMARAINRIVELQGGLAVVNNGQIMAEAPLPICGFMGAGPLEYLVQGFANTKKAMTDLGSSLSDPFLTLQTIPGTFLPYFRITLQGFVDLKNKKFVDLIVE